MYQVRDGKRVVPTCPECGCRLAQFESMWYHYYDEVKHFFRDARGCICNLYDKAFEMIDPNGKFDSGNILVV